MQLIDGCSHGDDWLPCGCGEIDWQWSCGGCGRQRCIQHRYSRRLNGGCRARDIHRRQSGGGGGGDDGANDGWHIDSIQCEILFEIDLRYAL